MHAEAHRRTNVERRLIAHALKTQGKCRAVHYFCGLNYGVARGLGIGCGKVVFEWLTPAPFDLPEEG